MSSSAGSGHGPGDGDVLAPYPSGLEALGWVQDMPHALCLPLWVLRPCRDLGAGERRRLQLPVHPPRSPSRAQSPIWDRSKPCRHLYPRSIPTAGAPRSTPRSA